MLEKSSSPVLTPQDLEAFQRGVVSDRIHEIWGLTYEQLRDIIQSQTYVTKDSDSPN